MLELGVRARRLRATRTMSRHVPTANCSEAFEQTRLALALSKHWRPRAVRLWDRVCASEQVCVGNEMLERVHEGSEGGTMITSRRVVTTLLIGAFVFGASAK